VQNYSAGFTAENLYRNELKETVKLQLAGMNKTEIRELVFEENRFQCRSEAAIKDLFPRVYKRSLVLDDTMRNFLVEGSRPDANAVLLYAFLKTYRFPREFNHEVIYYHYHSLKEVITDGNILAFFEQKEEQSETVRNWTGKTKYKIKQVTLKILTEAELLKRNDKEFFITPIPISSVLRHYVEGSKEYNDFLSLTLND